MTELLKNNISIYNNHFKGSNDLFRQFVGLYTDLKDGKLTPNSNPLKQLNINSVLKFSNYSFLINEENVVYKREAVFTLGNDESTKSFLQGQYGNTGISNEQALIDFLKSGKEIEDYCFNYSKTITKTPQIEFCYNTQESKYNFYVQSYETKLNDIPEELLPNYYIFSLALNQDLIKDIEQKDFNNSLFNADSSISEFKKKFDQLITLDNNIVFNSNIPNSELKDYYEQYSSVYDSVSVDVLASYKNKFGNVINSFDDQNSYLKLNQNKSLFPMYIDLSFTKNKNNSFFEFLKESNIGLDSIQSFISDKILTNNSKSFLQTFFEVSEKAFSNGSSLEYITSNHLQKDFDTWFKEYIQNLNKPIIDENDRENIIQLNSNSSVIGSRPIETRNNIQDPSLTLLIEQLLRDNTVYKYKDILTDNFRSPKEIFNGDLAKNDILFFRIEKREKSTNNFIQNIYLPNIPNIDVLNYIDTQVKYNKEYVYKIYSTHIVYGTKYKYVLKETKDEILLETGANQGMQEVKQSDSLRGRIDFGIKKEQKQTLTVNEGGQQIQFNSLTESDKSSIKLNNALQKIEQKIDGVETISIIVDEEIPRSGQVQNSFNLRSDDDYKVPGDTKKIPRSSKKVVVQGDHPPENQNESVINDEPDTDRYASFSRNEIQDEPKSSNSRRNLDFSKEVKNEYVFDMIYQPIVKLIECEYSEDISSKVIDFPPTLPDVSFYPLMESNGSFNISLQDSSYEYEDFFISILEEDLNYYPNLLENLKVKFRGDGDTKEFQIFRTDTEPESYRNFELYKTLTYPDQSVYLENIEPNKKYWYTFRVKDIHNNVSNPTSIYEVEIYNDQLLFIPSFKVYELKNSYDYEWNKAIKKYIKISPNIIHKLWNESNNRLGLAENNIYEKQFMMKVKSKHTSRVIDVYFKFKLDKNKPN